MTALRPVHIEVNAEVLREAVRLAQENTAPSSLPPSHVDRPEAPLPPVSGPTFHPPEPPQVLPAQPRNPKVMHASLSVTPDGIFDISVRGSLGAVATLAGELLWRVSATFAQRCRDKAGQLASGTLHTATAPVRGVWNIAQSAMSWVHAARRENVNPSSS